MITVSSTDGTDDKCEKANLMGCEEDPINEEEKRTDVVSSSGTDDKVGKCIEDMLLISAVFIDADIDGIDECTITDGEPAEDVEMENDPDSMPVSSVDNPDGNAEDNVTPIPKDEVTDSKDD